MHDGGGPKIFFWGSDRCGLAGMLQHNIPRAKIYFSFIT